MRQFESGRSRAWRLLYPASPRGLAVYEGLNDEVLGIADGIR